jgi:hypothetical protein
VPENCCPSCGSTNIAVGIAPDSTNVSLTCNYCNFRDVVYWGDSRKDAYDWFVSKRSAIARGFDLQRADYRIKVSRLRKSQRCQSKKSRRCNLVLLPFLRKRVDKFERLIFGQNVVIQLARQA